MSKEAAVRAMREARYHAAAKGAPATTTPAKAAKAATPTTPAVRPPAAAVEETPEPAAGEALCGHRSMNGRTCTREHGHASKSHRYS